MKIYFHLSVYIWILYSAISLISAVRNEPAQFLVGNTNYVKFNNTY